MITGYITFEKEMLPHNQIRLKTSFLVSIKLEKLKAVVITFNFTLFVS